ncbi:MAG: hypothetical protein H6613_06530 [Ignavibacteriales bacterium]|nr:hypothetical protein [Ignavibacteriales bacterium]
MLRLSGDAMTAEDITQNVFLKLFENYEALNSSESANFWLFTSARNEFYNLYKRNKKQTELSDSLLSTKKDEFELESYVEMKEMKKK